MSTTIIGLYESADAAQKAVQALVTAGSRRKDIDVLGGAGSADTITRKLVDHGFEKAEAQRYAAAVEQGRTLVAAHMADDSADAAAAILDENGALDLDDGTGEATEQESVPVVEEQVEIGKRKVGQGGARVTSTVVETPVRETVQLREEQVEVERNKLNRSLSGREAEAAFADRTLEMTGTAEKAEVTKEARVVGEVKLSKTATEREQTVEATARKTDVKVERTDGAAAKKR
jgi:stress response protein YsnF